MRNYISIPNTYTVNIILENRHNLSPELYNALVGFSVNTKEIKDLLDITIPNDTENDKEIMSYLHRKLLYEGFQEIKL